MRSSIVSEALNIDESAAVAVPAITWAQRGAEAKRGREWMRQRDYVGRHAPELLAQVGAR